MEMQEAMDAVQLALEMVGEAEEMVAETLEMLSPTERARAEVYLMQSFKTLRGAGNPYDESLPKLYDALLEIDDADNRC